MRPVEALVSEAALEVIVMWGDSTVLDVKHLSPMRSFVIGEAVEAHSGLPPTDFIVSPTLMNGRERLPLLSVDGDQVRLSITREMAGHVDIADELLTFDALQERGLLSVSSEVIGAHQYTLPSDAIASLQLGELRFLVRRVNAMPVIAASKPKIAWDSYGWVLGSLAFHAFFLVAFYFLPPQAMARNLDLMNMDQRYINYVIEPPELNEEPPPVLGDNPSGEDGKAHDGDSGQMGKPTAKRSKAHSAIQGDAKPQDRALSRDQAQAMAKSAGVIGMIKSAVGSWNTPTSPYGREQAIGSDPMNAIGAIMGDFAGDNFGHGGLGPIGTGRGGGGNGQGTIGTGDLGTIGTDRGPGGHGSGPYGSTVGKLGGHTSRVPTLKIGAAEVRGGLSKEAIRRVINRHIAEIRHCYEQELNARPDLEGRVAVKFMINTSGVVQLANISQSTLGNARAESCIQTAVQRWTFPAGTGVSMVSYPFMFNRAGE